MAINKLPKWKVWGLKLKTVYATIDAYLIKLRLKPLVSSEVKQFPTKFFWK